MALGFQPQCSSSVTRTKRRCFLKEDKVEVRSVEEGFQGSWHPGTVIESYKVDSQLNYAVKYDHILVDNGSDHLVDSLHTSEFVFENELCKSRGFIRPLPPPLKIVNWDLYYGMCVDVCYNEGWWEGVVFDHEDGSEERNIFFPDLGDEIRTHFASIRITRDWNDVTGTWKNRGTWLFLELLDEYEHQHYVPVSTKQLWYDLRQKDNFQKLGEWTSSEKDLWKILVSETIGDNLRIVMDHLSHVLGLPRLQGLLKSAKNTSDVTTYPQANLIQNVAKVPLENAPKSSNFHLTQQRSNVQQLDFLTQSDTSSQEQAVCKLPQISSVAGPKKDQNSATYFSANDDGFSNFDGNKINRKYSSSMHSKCSWQPAGLDMVPGAELCPDAVIKYAQMGKRADSALVDIRKHLLHLNWKIEYSKERQTKLRYISPDGKIYYSLHKVCLALSKLHTENSSSMSQDGYGNLFNCPGDSSSFLSKEPPVNEDSVVSFHSDVLSVEPEYCPEAALNWFQFGYKERLASKKERGKVQKMTERARKHLSAVGWKFRYVNYRGRRELCYISPRGRSYNSLRVACKDSMNERAHGTCASTYRHLEWKTVSEVVDGKSASEKISSALQKMEFQQLGCSSTESSCLSKFRNPIAIQNLKVGGIEKIQKKRKESLLASSLLQQEAISDSQCSLSKLGKRRKTRDLVKLQNNRIGTRNNCVLRSSKRVLNVVVPNSSHQKPLTVLSWLIDNNIVLPRAKVHYKSTMGRHRIAEGRISRDGIKCNCCGKVYSLSGFKFHVSGKYHRPASSIFLEDGRSLLDCQMKIVSEEMRNFVAEPPENLKGNLHQGENDHICSVCHYGGELVLCDQCPSSFHKSCIGVVDVPDGDWFCPSCCCKICGQNKLKRDTKYTMKDECARNCTQCERKYHINCLRIQRKDSLKSCHKGNWFCSKKCKEIFLGLHKLLGKPVPVGLNNLTWTLLKFIHFDGHKLNSFDIEAQTENCSKLNIALDVMHECFEPVEEPRTKRDLLKDVIFSKKSELNRLNFGGFYTVLLQKDDEFVTVATVRLYGEKVAEVPLVGTRFQYRRLGMCRILMTVLEKKLMELGVQRLILPAVPSVLNTWTGSFGFSKMTVSERLQFVDYTFLDFQDTVMCHKLLMKIPSTESCPSREVLPRLCNDAGEDRENMDPDGSIAVSEVLEADQIACGTANQGQADIAAIGCNGRAEGPIKLDRVITLKLKSGKSSEDLPVDQSTCKMETRNNGSNTSNTFSSNGEFKCYRRRRILACSN